MSETNSIHARTRSRRLSAMLVGVLAAGCIYRIDIQQGNYLDERAIEQLEVGMTRSQVRFLLGTPMVEDSFNDDRWDYVYYFRPGRGGELEGRRLTVHFNGESVERIETAEIDVDIG